MSDDLIGSLDQFAGVAGTWLCEPTTRALTATEFVGIKDSPASYAENHLVGVLAADFSFAAEVQFGSGGEAHLQFRISADGRYGVRVSEQGFAVYIQNAITNQWTALDDVAMDLAPNTLHPVEISVQGSGFTIMVVDTEYSFHDELIPVGRLGLYAYQPNSAAFPVTFSGIYANTVPAALSNFALLHSTLGYTALGTKRALLRTLNHLDDGLDLQRCGFAVENTAGDVVYTGPLSALRDTYGMQLWEADFTSLQAPGTYRVTVTAVTAGPLVWTHQLTSAMFGIDQYLLTRSLLRPLTVLNAEARNAADDDLRQNWSPVSGEFTLDHTGALIGTDTTRGAGALLERTKTGFGTNATLPSPQQASGYTMIGQVTILDGCDAQLQFGITASRRLAATLQAGAAGNCQPPGGPPAGGPGAVRLHEEGPAVAGGFNILASQYFPSDEPFKIGVPYAVRIVVTPQAVTVFVNGGKSTGGLELPTVLTPVDLQHGTFGVKAWASSAKFENVGVWANGKPAFAGQYVQMQPIGLDDGRIIDRPQLEPGPCNCDGSTTDPGDPANKIKPNPGVEHPLCLPIFAQRCGFYDCDSINGESNSHGAFIAGLIEVWLRRGAQLSGDERLGLQAAILAGVAYLGRLFDLGVDGDGAGRYKHEDFGRNGGADINSCGQFLTYLTLSGVYGDLSFAAKAAELDAVTAAAAMRRAWKGCLRLERDGLAPTHRVLVYHYLAKCAAADPEFAAEVQAQLGGAGPVSNQLDEIALNTAESFLFDTPTAGTTGFGTLEGWREAPRDTGQMIPWLEGVHALSQDLPDRTAHWAQPLAELAQDMVNYLTTNNGFHVIPQSSGGDPQLIQNCYNWDSMDVVPRVGSTVAGEGRSFYNCSFFSTEALDMVLLSEMSGNAELEQLAAGHLYWVLGLNPGMSATKTLNAATEGTAWRAGAFVQGLPGSPARGYENIADGWSNEKDWLWPGEDWGNHRQVWRFNPLPGFMSINNGLVLFENQWDYYNIGPDGWISGETFILNDGIYARAMVTYEDHFIGPPQPEPTVMIGFNPQDRFMMTLGSTLVVVTSDGNVFGADAVGRLLEPVVQFGGARIGFNPQDRFMMTLGNTLVVVTSDGNVFGADVVGHELQPVYQFSGARIGFNPQDRFMMALGNTLVVVTADGEVFGADVVGQQLQPVYQFGGARIGFNPQDRFMMALGNTLVVVTADGEVFGTDVGVQLAPVFEYDAVPLRN
jgi:Cellulase N-terminal ig-like domain